MLRDMLYSLALLIAGANIAVAIEDSGGVDPLDGELITSIFRQAIEKRTGESVEVVAALPASCSVRIVCISAILRVTQATAVVLLQLVDAPTKIAVIAERVDDSARTIETHRVDLPRERKKWGVLLGEVVAKLFDAPPPPPKVVEPHAPEKEAKLLPPGTANVAPVASEPSIAPWVLGGTGVALAITGGVLFGAAESSVRALDAKIVRACDSCLITEPSYEEWKVESDSIRTQQGAGIAGVSVGLSALLAGAAWLLLDATD